MYAFENADISEYNFADRFARTGFLGPIRVLTPAECRRFLRVANARHSPILLDWNKSSAVVSRPFYEIASHPAIVNIVVNLIGENVMLWGASIQSRPPRNIHPWHSDIESAKYPGQTVSAWIGLKNVSRKSSLSVVSFSHRFGASIQEVRQSHGIDRETTGIELIDSWAQGINNESEVLTPNLAKGDVLFFDGSLWHGSNNTSRRTRHALLLQYATQDTPIRIPDFNFLDWPFAFLETPRPPCIMIRGITDGKQNRIVSPAVAKSEIRPRLTSRSHHLEIPLPPPTSSSVKSFHLFDGSTPNISMLSSHVSVLKTGDMPHPPHKHPGEELLLLLCGEVDLIVPGSNTVQSEKTVRLSAGQFVFYPANFEHSLRTASAEPANYLMFKWFNETAKSPSRLNFSHFDTNDGRNESEIESGFTVRGLFDAPTSCLRRLHSHVSTLTPQAGYAAHVDAHDVAIVLMAGEIESMGIRYKPISVIYFPAGELHDMHNPSDSIARYLVFEFHGHNGQFSSYFRGRVGSFIEKIKDPARWKNKLKRVLEKKQRSPNY